jgi:pimeloyl-ACP methyl ester carboxylesterase
MAMVLYGIAVLRSRALARWSGVLAVAFGALLVVQFLAGRVIPAVLYVAGLPLGISALVRVIRPTEPSSIRPLCHRPDGYWVLSIVSFRLPAGDVPSRPARRGRLRSLRENHMTSLACSRSGAGAPLVLLHGLGSSRRAWDPVIPALAKHFEVIAVDLPGFGDSGPVPAPGEPLPATLATAVAGLLDDLGVSTAHLAGNSLGGWVALELAAIRPAASLTLLSPAGLWRGRVPRYNRVSLKASSWLARHAAGLLSRLVTCRLGRVLVLGQTHGRPAQLTPAYARATITAMSASPGFDATMRATATRRYLATAPITAPVTVAFGSRDRLLLRHQSRHLDQLPAGTRIQVLPGCGHVPMADDPGAVTGVIAHTAARTTACAVRVSSGMGDGRRRHT